MAKKIKRSYNKDVREKIQGGKSWRLQLDIDHDNAENILDEIDNSITGGEYKTVINNVIRQYFAKKKKAA